jgi:hypothetical protein
MILGGQNFTNRDALLAGIAQPPPQKRSRYDEYFTPRMPTAEDHAIPRALSLNKSLKDAGVDMDNETIKNAVTRALTVTRNAPKRRVPYADNKRLAELISHHGIIQNPELNSIPTAKSWLDKKIADAQKRGNDREVARWSKYDVDYQDYDDNPLTIDNVVVYNTADPGDVYAVDGYRMKSRDDDLIQRGYYTTYPTAAERKTNKLTPEYRAYLRKYPTEELRAKYKFDQKFVDYFNEKESLYTLMHKYITEKATVIGFTPRVDPTNAISDTKVAPWHYTPILSKVTSRIYHDVLKVLAADKNDSLYNNIGITWASYNFNTDPYKILKVKDFMRNMKAIWLKTNNKEVLIPIERISDTIVTVANSVDSSNNRLYNITITRDENKRITNITDPDATKINDARIAKTTKHAPINRKQLYTTTNTDIFSKYQSPHNVFTRANVAAMGRRTRGGASLPGSVLNSPHLGSLFSGDSHIVVDSTGGLFAGGAPGGSGLGGGGGIGDVDMSGGGGTLPVFKPTIPRNTITYMKYGPDEQTMIPRQIFKGELGQNLLTKELSAEDSLAADWLRNDKGIMDGILGASPVLMLNGRQVMLTFTDGSTAIVPKPNSVKSQANLN